MTNGGALSQTDKRSPPITVLPTPLSKNHPLSHCRHCILVKYAHSSRLHEFVCGQQLARISISFHSYLHGILMHRSNFASTIRNTTLCTYKAYNNSGQTIALRIAFDSSTMKSLVRIMQTGSIPLYLIRLTTLPIYTVEGWDHCRLQKT